MNNKIIMSSIASERVMDIITEFYLAQPEGSTISCSDCFDYLLSHANCPMSVKHDRQLKANIKSVVFSVINDQNQKRI